MDLYKNKMEYPVNRARFLVNDAERAEVKSVVRAQRHARIEPQSEFARDERIGQRADVGLGIRKKPWLFG